MRRLLADLGGMAPAGRQRIMTPAFASTETEGSGPAYAMFALGLIIVCGSSVDGAGNFLRSDRSWKTENLHEQEKLQLQTAFNAVTSLLFSSRRCCSRDVAAALVTSLLLRYCHVLLSCTSNP
jgi:hypothetical protein